jgi:hypothetical protein
MPQPRHLGEGLDQTARRGELGAVIARHPQGAREPLDQGG